MTPERIAELRRLAEEWECGIDPALASELAHAIPELLDELEALTKQHKQDIANVLAGRDDAFAELTERLRLTQIRAEASEKSETSLAAQVVQLREALEAAEREVWAWQAGADAYGATSLTDYHPPEFEPSALLADTEAAATTWLEAHDREQRLAGARGMSIKEHYASDEPSDVTCDGWMLGGLSNGLPLWRCIGCGVYRGAHVFRTAYCTGQATTEQRLVAAFNGAMQREARQ